MRRIERILGDFNPLVFTMDLRDVGKADTDIADIFFAVKAENSDLDNALLLKTFTGGGITFTGTTKLTVSVEWLDTEYTGFVVGQVYKVALFPLFTGDPVADENVTKKPELVIVDDLLKQN